MASFRNSLLQTLLVAAVATPVVGCGGETTEDTAEAGGAAGSSSGTSGQGGGSGASGKGGAGTGGAAGVSTGGAAGISTVGGSGGAVSTGGSGGQPGTGGASTGGQPGTGGASTGGSAGQPGTGGSAGAVSTGGSAGGATVPCDSPQLITVGAEMPTGLVRCANGAILRAYATTCPNLIDTGATVCEAPGGGAEGCATSADCTTKPYGVCGSLWESPCQCNYGCVQDSDCAADELCQCGTPIGRCVKATCKTDDDCAEGGCAQVEVGLPGCGTQAFACQKLADQCASNEQCQNNGPGGLCHVENPGDPRKCEPFSCAVGRPLVVEQGWRLAALQASPAWG